MRAVTSVALPGVNPTTSLTGFSGQVVWAPADHDAASAKASVVAIRTTKFIVFSLGREDSTEHA